MVAFRIIEYRYNEMISSLENAFWLTFSTMFCIGYGDITPMTNVGKWIGLVSMYTGVIFTYFTITLITNLFKLNSRNVYIKIDEKRTLALILSLQKKK